MSKDVKFIFVVLGIGVVLCIAASLLPEQKPEPPKKHWYGEYCYPGKASDLCEFRNGDGNDCPIQVNDKDVISSINMRLKDGSCKVQ